MSDYKAMDVESGEDKPETCAQCKRIVVSIVNPRLTQFRNAFRIAIAVILSICIFVGVYVGLVRSSFKTETVVTVANVEALGLTSNRVACALYMRSANGSYTNLCRMADYCRKFTYEEATICFGGHANNGYYQFPKDQHSSCMSYYVAGYSDMKNYLLYAGAHRSPSYIWNECPSQEPVLVTIKSIPSYREAITDTLAVLSYVEMVLTAFFLSICMTYRHRGCGWCTVTELKTVVAVAIEAKKEEQPRQQVLEHP